MLSLFAPPLPNIIRIKIKIPKSRRFKPLPVSSSFSRNQRGPPPPPPPGSNLYQPFRPPPSPLPDKYRSLDPAQLLNILSNRLGLWHEYAPLISSLTHDGFTPSSIEELTGISSVEQNRLAVASHVRDSLSLSAPDLLPLFDPASSADLLYELRLLNTSQRAAASRYALQQQYDAKAAQELSRAIRDFPKRRGDHGWDSFSPDSPADCLAFTHFRAGRESIAVAEKLSAFEKALETAESDKAKGKIQKEIDKATGKKGGDDQAEEDEVEVLAKLPVVRLKYGEVAEAASVVLLPAVKETEGTEGVKSAPGYCKWESGELGVVEAEKEWKRWVVLPGWAAVLGMGGEGGVAVEFKDGRVLPWRLRRWEKEEGLVVVVDRRRKRGGGDEEVERDWFYLVSDGEGMVIERGRDVGEEKEVLGAVVVVVRPPKEDDDQLSEEDWD